MTARFALPHLATTDICLFPANDLDYGTEFYRRRKIYTTGSFGSRLARCRSQGTAFLASRLTVDPRRQILLGGLVQLLLASPALMPSCRHAGTYLRCAFFKDEQRAVYGTWNRDTAPMHDGHARPPSAPESRATRSPQVLTSPARQNTCLVSLRSAKNALMASRMDIHRPQTTTLAPLRLCRRLRALDRITRHSVSLTTCARRNFDSTHCVRDVVYAVDVRLIDARRTLVRLVRADLSRLSVFVPQPAPIPGPKTVHIPSVTLVPHDMSGQA
ncbi:hypothetical protein VTO73DRAFT_10170 [Trametes versicolor]